MSILEKTAAVIAVLLSMVLSNNVSAQNPEIASINAKSVGNLVMGISSDNYGLKRSSIYYAGKYKVAETADVLLAEMKNSDDTNLKCLIAVTLYKIKDARAMEYILKLSRYSDDSKVRRTCKAISELYTIETSSVVAEK